MASTSKRPNVIIILSDDQGYGDLGCHGNPVVKTPRTDRLYHESVRFTDFHVAPMCTPSRAQLLSGRDALASKASRVANGKSFLRSGLPTMADIFRENGYATGLFGKWHLGDNYPFRPEDRGFDETVWFPSAAITSSTDYWDNDYFDDHYRNNGTIKQYQGYCTDVFFDEAMRWIGERGELDEPFFAYIATSADHVPLFVPDQYRDPYRDISDIFLQSFLATIANLDENIGKLDDFLSKTNLLDDTIFVFMSDNGTNLGEEIYNAGMRGVKSTYYEGGHRVPCFVRWPASGIGGSREIDETVQCQDLLPTFMDLCGMQTSADIKFDGMSLSPLLRNGDARLPDRMLVIQHREAAQKGNAAVLWNKWRLIELSELYNVESDPGQTTDVSGDHPDIVEKMTDHYERWYAALEPSVFEYEKIAVGSEHEPETCLSAVDWSDARMFMFQAGVRDIYSGGGNTPPERMSGIWHLHVELPGTYQIELRRWPVEADAAIRGVVPDFDPSDRSFIGVEGVEPFGDVEKMNKHEKQAALWLGSTVGSVMLPVASARISIQGNDRKRPVGDSDKAAIFTCTLCQGDALLQTWFLDDADSVICGALYVYMRKIDSKTQ